MNNKLREEIEKIMNKYSPEYGDRRDFIKFISKYLSNKIQVSYELDGHSQVTKLKVVIDE